MTRTKKKFVVKQLSSTNHKVSIYYNSIQIRRFTATLNFWLRVAVNRRGFIRKYSEYLIMYEKTKFHYLELKLFHLIKIHDMIRYNTLLA